ncbi:MAG: TonB-dependent receptor [Bacteroidetes bacterium]|nr:TonB-dependent receptor [Bacteroidota bacterium]
MSNLSKIILFLLLCIREMVPVYAQEAISLRGTVVDAGGALPGVTVMVRKEEHTPKAVAVTDRFGKFSVSVVLPVTLVVTFVGFKREEIEIQKPPTEDLLITLQEEANLMNELVVLGYAQQKRGSITSAVSIVKGDQFENSASQTLSGKLQGEIPGLIISSNSGVPGTSSLVRLRGTTSISANNDPIYIIDGTQVSTIRLQQQALGGQNIDPLSDLNPDDIESVSVLKDASATAAYGAKGANGVILITTKRGEGVQKTTVNFGSEFGFARAENLWQLVTGTQHAQIVNEAYKNDDRWERRPFRPPGENPSGGTAFGNPEDQPTYSRIPDIFRTGLTQKYTLSVAGSNDKSNFFVGGEINNQEATLKMQEFNRMSFRLNLDHSITGRVKIGTSNALSFTNRELVRVGDGPAGLFQAALHTPTFYPIYNEDGTYNRPTSFDNHQAIIDHNDGHSNGMRIVNNVFARFEIMKGLTFKSSWSNDRNVYHEKFYFNTYLNSGSSTNGQANDNMNTSNIFGAEQTLNFFRTLRGVHTVSAFLGNSYQKRIRESARITGTQFPSNEFKRITSAAVTTASTNGTSSSMLSFFGGVNYSYENRYSLDLTLRADGSSRVSADHRWGYFPAVGVAWNIGNEKFFPKKQESLSNLRLRGSWGYTGNESIDDYASLGLWSGGSDYDDKPGISPSQLENPDLRWETTRQWNIGLSSGFLNNNLIVEFDYYHKYTYDLLLSVPLPGKTGLGNITKNSGAVSNKGIELLINATNIRKGDFSWKTIFTLSRNANRIEILPIEQQGGYTMYKLFEGKPMYSFWVWNYLGVDPKTGDAVYEDVDKDGTLTLDDKKIVGDAWPLFEGTFKNVLTYKNWSLDFNFYYKTGNRMFNYTRMFLESGGTSGITRSIQSSSMNYWKEEEKATYKAGRDGLLHDVLPRPKSTVNPDGSFNYERQSSRFVEDASYVRLRNVTVSCLLPQTWSKKMGLQRVRLYITASNLLLITKYTGPDPEVGLESDSLVQGLDFGTPPQPRALIGGVSFTF